MFVNVSRIIFRIDLYIFFFMSLFLILWSLLMQIVIASSILSREGNGTPLQYSCLENPMNRGAWWAAVHGVVKSWI